jgi:8-oxo-dGTP pyrophosphatase MutT (NUDIX family)
MYVLSTKRSSNMIDEPYKMCVPCGYLDWDESGPEAALRELQEETKIDIGKVEAYTYVKNE